MKISLTIRICLPVLFMTTICVAQTKATLHSTTKLDSLKREVKIATAQKATLQKMSTDTMKYASKINEKCKVLLDSDPNFYNTEQGVKYAGEIERIKTVNVHLLNSIDEVSYRISHLNDDIVKVTGTQRLKIGGHVKPVQVNEKNGVITF